MPVYNLEFQTEIKASPQAAHDHLSDPHHLIGLQPLLTHVETVQFGEQDGIKNVSYETVEAFRWMSIVLYRNRIHVQTVFTNPPLQFNTVAHSFPNITLNVEYNFTAQDGGALVKEAMQIHTHSILSKFVIGEAIKAQTALLANLKNRLESL